MKIAVTYEGGSIFQHFGKTETFKMYTIMKEIMRQNERKKGLENEQYLFEQRNIYDDNTDDHLFKDPVLYYMEPE